MTARDKVYAFLCAALIALTVFIPMYLMNKGIDVTDVGQMLTNYRNAFDNGLSISLGTGLSSVAGGIIVRLFPHCPLLALQVVLWVSYIGMGVMVWLLLKDKVPTLPLLAAIFAGTMFYRKLAPTFGYNSISALVLIAGLLMLMTALRKDSRLLLAASGIIFACNALFRLPNILQMGMIVAVFWYYLHGEGGVKKAFSRSAMFISCVALLGVAFVFVYGLGNFWEDVMHYVALGSRGSHSITNMIGDQIRGYGAGVAWCCIFFALPIVVAVAGTVIKRYRAPFGEKYIKPVSKYAPIAAAVYAALFAVIFYLIHDSVRDSILNVRVIYAICMLSVVLGVYCAVRYRKDDRDFSALSLAFAIGIATFSMGTDNGIMIDHCIALLIIPYILAAV